jgi:RHS repeat-associated protein
VVTDNRLDAAPHPVSQYAYTVNPIRQLDKVETVGTAFGVAPVWKWAYNPRGELVSAKDTSASNRISRSVGVPPTSTTFYLYDGWNVICEYPGSAPALARTYTWGTDLSSTLQGAGGLLAVSQIIQSLIPNVSSYYPTYDGNGNVSEYLETTGELAVHYEYDPFGTLTRQTGSISTRFQYRFSTKPRDILTGMYYYGYRYYNPLTGRWPSRDPIGETGGVNLHGFVGNDAANQIDLLGLTTTYRLSLEVKVKGLHEEVVTGPYHMGITYTNRTYDAMNESGTITHTVEFECEGDDVVEGNAGMNRPVIKYNGGMTAYAYSRVPTTAWGTAPGLLTINELRVNAWSSATSFTGQKNLSLHGEQSFTTSRAAQRNGGGLYHDLVISGGGVYSRSMADRSAGDNFILALLGELSYVSDFTSIMDAAAASSLTFKYTGAYAYKYRISCCKGVPIIKRTDGSEFDTAPNLDIIVPSLHDSFGVAP